MFNYKIFSFCLIFILTSSLSWAVPASNIQLSYDVDSKVLHVEADHVTTRLERYFIGRVVITKNSDTTQSFYFHRQDRPDRFVEDINYEAMPGEHMDVQLYSTEGGVAEASLDIPMPVIPDKDK